VGHGSSSVGLPTVEEFMISRRDFVAATGGLAAGLAWDCQRAWAQANARPPLRIKDARIKDNVVVEAEDGTQGSFPIVGQDPRASLAPHAARIRELLVGRTAFDPALEGEMLWEAMYPGKASLYAQGRDPLTGEAVANKPRGGRHTKTGALFIGFSAVDIAIWDLRARLSKLPGYQVIGKADRKQLLVYWRPGEPKLGLDDARRRAREAFDRGYKHQKWYFRYSAEHGKQGLKDNIELVRVLREELGPEAKLMFDNHGIRYGDNVEYSVNLCKAVQPYHPFWIEEPICPEHVDGYARIKEETGLPIAGGEHLYTRWPVKAFLERKCIDFVQSDPIWCGGISEWLRVCEMVKPYPGVKVVPHITSPWVVAPHCVASQPKGLCPLLEFNYEGGRQSLESRMHRSAQGDMLLAMPDEPGVS